MVEEAWDEATSSFPSGRHPENSPHYEGRAAILYMSVELSDEDLGDPPDTAPPVNASLQQALGQYAVCVGMDYVKLQDEGRVTVGVKKVILNARQTHAKLTNWMLNSKFGLLFLRILNPHYKCTSTYFVINSNFSNKITLCYNYWIQSLYIYSLIVAL